MNDDQPPGEHEPRGSALTLRASESGSVETLKVGLGSGRSVEIEDRAGSEQLVVRAKDGSLVLSLRLTDEGPVLTLSGVSLEIAAQKRLSLACETLSVAASGDATVDVGGNLYERARGSAVREVGLASVERAREVKVEAFPGGVAITANDDVDVRGERVRLNSDDPPMPLTWEEHRARQAKRLAAGESSEGESWAELLRAMRPPLPGK